MSVAPGVWKRLTILFAVFAALFNLGSLPTGLIGIALFAAGIALHLRSPQWSVVTLAIAGIVSTAIFYQRAGDSFSEDRYVPIAFGIFIFLMIPALFGFIDHRRSRTRST